jgi:hypothetical protein
MQYDKRKGMTTVGGFKSSLFRCCLNHPPTAIPSLATQEITPHCLFWEGTWVRHCRHFTLGNSISAVSDPRVKFLSWF